MFELEIFWISVSEPWDAERGHTQSQPIQVYLTGRHCFLVMANLRQAAGRPLKLFSPTQVSKAPSSESLEQAKASDLTQVGKD